MRTRLWVIVAAIVAALLTSGSAAAVAHHRLHHVAVHHVLHFAHHRHALTAYASAPAAWSWDGEERASSSQHAWSADTWSTSAPRRSWRRHYAAQPAQHYSGLAGLAGSGLETVNTVAGLPITVASSVASKFEGFIGDLVASGYRPRQIHCAANGGHVRASNHYWGGACDIDQTGRGRTAGRMYHVADLARKWGLRDGCSFGDCGHVDVPRMGRERPYAGT